MQTGVVDKSSLYKLCLQQVSILVYVLHTPHKYLTAKLSISSCYSKGYPSYFGYFWIIPQVKLDVLRRCTSSYKTAGRKQKAMFRSAATEVQQYVCDVWHTEETRCRQDELT